MPDPMPIAAWDQPMDTAPFPFNPADDEACRIQAAVLMHRAIALLDHAGEARTATHLQHAIDTLTLRLPDVGQPH